LCDSLVEYGHFAPVVGARRRDPLLALLSKMSDVEWIAARLFAAGKSVVGRLSQQRPMGAFRGATRGASCEATSGLSRETSRGGGIARRFVPIRGGQPQTSGNG
jgi:hypothetical protein